MSNARAYAMRQLEASARRLSELREPAGAAERQARTLAMKLAEASESRVCRPEQSQVLFVAADRLRHLASMVALAEAALPDTERLAAGPAGDERARIGAIDRDLARAGPAVRQAMETAVWQMNLLVLECALSLPEGTSPEPNGAARELEQLARDLNAISTNWRTLAADAAWAAREAAWQIGRP